ncbi:MAG TPA: DUF4163 domain-containing protein [Novosphingobium sp.]|nr:DUF4163 domain-containing protein [Novosphingobium sp.]
MPIHRIVPFLAAALLASCQGANESPDEAAETPVASGAAAGSSAPEAAAVPAGKARKVAEESDLYSFEYAYPAQADAIPELRAILDARLAKDRTELATEARNFKKEAEADGFPYRPSSREIAWLVVSDLPDWLSLSAEGYVYSGGAHGMSFFDTLLWDRKARTVREPTELFASTAALSSAIGVPFCAALDKEREKRRGEPVVRSPDDPFSECIDPAKETVILGSSNGRTFDRIGVLVAPYSAGPYAEGTYEVTLPVTRAVIDAVKPAFRGSFSTGR